MFRRLLTATVFGLIVASHLYGQSLPTASRLADLQVGVDLSLAKSDYTNSDADPGTGNVYNLGQPTTSSLDWRGYGAYANLDFRYHYGIVIDFHQVSGSDSNLYERTFEAGGRYLWPIRDRFIPYGKVLVGRGIFNFAAQDSNGQSQQIANLAFTTESFGGGLDLRLRPGLNIRVLDYEYQHWNHFPPNKLNPQVLSFGIAYHFHGPMAAELAFLSRACESKMSP